MKNRAVTILFGVILLLLLSGCESNATEEYAETTVSIDKKGRVVENVVEMFDKDYYDVTELSDEFTSAIAGIVSEEIPEGSIRLDDVHVENGKIFVSLSFDSAKGYEALQNETLFMGTINDAYDSGYSMDVMLKGTGNGDKIGKVEIMGMKDRHIIIMSEPVKLSSYSDIKYVSANVDVLGEREARILSESGGLAYIILDK